MSINRINPYIRHSVFQGALFFCCLKKIGDFRCAYGAEVWVTAQSNISEWYLNEFWLFGGGGGSQNFEEKFGFFFSSKVG